MLSQLCPSVGARWFGPGDSIRHGNASQDRDSTLDRWGTGLVFSGEVQNKWAEIVLELK